MRKTLVAGSLILIGLGIIEQVLRLVGLIKDLHEEEHHHHSPLPAVRKYHNESRPK